VSEVSTIGLDIAKHVFQVHGADASGRVVFRKKIPRSKLMEFFGRGSNQGNTQNEKSLYHQALSISGVAWKWHFLNHAVSKPPGLIMRCKCLEMQGQVAANLPHPGDRARGNGARVAPGPTARAHLGQEVAQDAVELVRRLQINGVPAIRDHGQRGGRDRPLEQ